MNNKDFDDWWNGDHLPPNPYPKDSPVFWAWAGWQMGVKAERDRAARMCGIVMQKYETEFKLSPDQNKVGFLSAELCKVLIEKGEE